MLERATWQWVAKPALMAYSTTRLFKTGKTPGKPAHTGQVFWLGSWPNLVEQPQKIFEWVRS
jgi:hypothetical protein